MVTYGDYFSRRILHGCGVSPTKILFEKDEKSYTGMQRTEKIRSDMNEIYQTLYRGYTEKNGAVEKQGFADFQVERKIVAAFYDSGILSAPERDYFQTQAPQAIDTREQICVEEAALSSVERTAQRVEVQTKAPLVRDVR